ncbi:MAG TPA: hypothetical protein VKU00_02280 [Chthonomonadaceae bacterium]|nr:hypothetical protein [Chthonomonadaceae bacterium]
MLIIPFTVEMLVGFASARYRAHERTCEKNIRAISQALLQYSADWDMTFPPAKHWADATSLHIKPREIPQVFRCPEAHSPYAFVFNVNLDRLRLEQLVEPSVTPMLYEGEVNDFNATGDGITIPIAKRHMDGSYYAFADGHAKYISQTFHPSAFKALNWRNTSAPENHSSKP